MKREFMTTNSAFHLRIQVYEDIEDYKDDYTQVIRQREVNRIAFGHNSPQHAFRGDLVELIKKICVTRALSQSCLHLAIYIMDIFMDNHIIVVERLVLVAVVCLLIADVAAKFEENTLTTPKIAELNNLINNRYETIHYKSMEIVILTFFDFNIMHPTAAHYIYYYIQKAICYNDLHEERNFRTLFYELYDAITGFLDFIISDVHYTQCYKPTKLAAAIIATSRTNIGLSIWTEELERITMYKVEQLHQLIRQLLGGAVLRCTKCKFDNK